jgi:hypothetical protein
MIGPEDPTINYSVVNFTVLNFAEERYLTTLIIMVILSQTFLPELKLIACVFSKIVI